MILEKQTAHLVLDTQEAETISMGIDVESAPMLMQLLSKNLYSDNVGSPIREVCSNSLDSQIRAGTIKPIIVSLKMDRQYNYEFSVEDWGVGLDDEDVKSLISKYGKSTKRLVVNELGSFGLGFKSPLAYSSSFCFIARKNGIERKYMMYEGDDNENKIDLLYEQPTTEANGVKVIIAVSSYDKIKFYYKMKEQLAYFENVYFDVNVNGSTIDNNFSIFRTDDFQWSELCNDSNMHLSLGDVYYPIDWQKLGITAINIPVALRFGLSDGVFPTLNREAIRYTEEAKTIILEKIKKVADWFVNKYNENFSVAGDIKSIYAYYSNSAKLVKIVDKEFNINALSKFASIALKTPTIPGVTHLNLSTLFSNNTFVNGFTSTTRLHYGRISKTRSWYSVEAPIEAFLNKNVCIYTETLKEKQKAYFRSTIPNHTSFYFVRAYRKWVLKAKDWNHDDMSYYSQLNLQAHPKSEWREIIMEFQHVQSLILEHAYNADTLDISEWVKANKPVKTSNIAYGNTIAKPKRQKIEGTLSVKKAEELQRYVGGQNCKFTSYTMGVKSLQKHPGLIIIETHDNKHRLDSVFSLVSEYKAMLLTLSEKEYNLLQSYKIHNVITYSKFMEGNNKAFKRIATAILINKLVSDYSHVFGRNVALPLLNKDFSNKVEACRNYRKKYGVSLPEHVKNAIITTAEEHNLFDMHIYHVYGEVKGILEKHYYLNDIIDALPSYHDEHHPLFRALVDLAKYHKLKLNTNLYNNTKKEQL